MKTGLVSISFRSLSPNQIIALTAEAGLESIEWGGDIHVPAGNMENALCVGECTRAAGLTVACYGSYYRLTDAESGMAKPVVQTAKALGAPLIRVWAGNLASADAGEVHRAMIVKNARRIADLAAEEKISVAFEYHGGTLTDDAASAKALLEAVNRENCFTLWQPPVNMSIPDCLASIRTVGPWIRNIHVFSWKGGERLPLADGAEKWRACLNEIALLPGEHSLMLEFVRGDDPAQLIEDAKTLKNWLKGDFER